MSEDLLFEIGTEELPAGAVDPGVDQLRTGVLSGLEQARLAHGAARTFATPRRLALLVEGVADRSPDATRQALGPSVKAAFGADGTPTRAATKFAEAQGVAVSALRRVQTPKGEYLAAEVTEAGRPASALLPGVLGAAVHGIQFRKSMRWGDVEQTFARPVQWLLALYGQEVVPVVFADVKSGRMTLGHRFLSPGPHPVAHPRDYPGLLERAQVLADVSRRKERIRTDAAEAARSAGGHIREDEPLLDQVTELVEWPTAVLGSFEQRHLDRPPEVLVQEMTSHQRYFPVVDAAGKLLPRFVAISNTPVKDPALSRRGYESVLRSRLSDGRFFFDEDRKVPLAARVPALERVVWQGKLGTYAEKVGRIRLLAASLTRAVGRPELLEVVDRAALLAKADRSPPESRPRSPRPSPTITCRAAPRTRCPPTTPEPWWGWPTGWTPWPGCSRWESPRPHRPIRSGSAGRAWAWSTSCSGGGTGCRSARRWTGRWRGSGRSSASGRPRWPRPGRSSSSSSAAGSARSGPTGPGPTWWRPSSRRASTT